MARGKTSGSGIRNSKRAYGIVQLEVAHRQQGWLWMSTAALFALCLIVYIPATIITVAPPATRDGTHNPRSMIAALQSSRPCRSMNAFFA
jgi:hypothetical protein